ncbi:MAG: hypothetical protein GX131_12120 [candidate division WS1 bacterium]|nr:hypothetical protein [candidate division WS1 bacterium]
MSSSWRSKIRSAFALVAAVFAGWWLSGIGWPWWAWLPAAILVAMAVYMTFVFGWFLYRKLTYEPFARAAKRRNRAAAAEE